MTTILIIDDDEQIRIALSKTLKRAGYETIWANNGEEGIKLFKEKGPDLIITDLIMPEKEGIETIVELRRSYPDVKIIAMSGGGKNGPEDYLPMAKRLGARITLKKPFRVNDLLEAVSKILKSRPVI